MKFNDLYDEELANLLKENNINKIFDYIYKNDLTLLELKGYSSYYILYESGNYNLIGFKPFSSLKKVANYINETFEECVDVPEGLLKEDLAIAKFKYDNWKHDPKPKIIVLDADYIYNGKGKIVPGQHDILAYNINYSDNKKLTKQAIQEITTFAHMLKKDKKDVYQRIKDFYPDSLKYIRHYKPEHIRGLKMKDGWKWKKCSVVDLEDRNNSNRQEWKF